MDLLDEISELATSVQPEEAPPIRLKFIIVVLVRGRWRVKRYTGRASECQGHVMETLGVDIADPSTQWARGYRTDSGAIVVHPRNNSVAQQMIVERLKRSR